MSPPALVAVSPLISSLRTFFATWVSRSASGAWHVIVPTRLIARRSRRSYVGICNTPAWAGSLPIERRHAQRAASSSRKTRGRTERFGFAKSLLYRLSRRETGNMGQQGTTMRDDKRALAWDHGVTSVE